MVLDAGAHSNVPMNIPNPNGTQWNLSIKDTLDKGHLPMKDTACCPNYIQMCAKQALNCGHLPVRGQTAGSQWVRYRVVPLYSTSKVDIYIPTVLVT